jgi:hypothetical protein
MSNENENTNENVANTDVTNSEQTSPATETPVEAAPTEPTTNNGNISVTMTGAISGAYEGPAGKTLKEMFPDLAGDTKYQVRLSGKMASQVQPWMVSGEIKTVEHAKHG